MDTPVPVPLPWATAMNAVGLSGITDLAERVGVPVETIARIVHGDVRWTKQYVSQQLWDDVARVLAVSPAKVVAWADPVNAAVERLRQRSHTPGDAHKFSAAALAHVGMDVLEATLRQELADKVTDWTPVCDTPVAVFPQHGQRETSPRPGPEVQPH
ncbi:helix-turn-helix domain-containing protein [Nocardia niigatensis]